MADVSLVYVPFGALERPSLALGLLKSALVNAGISCEVNYCTFEFADRIGLEMYGKLAWMREEMIGEWIFSAAAFPDFCPDNDAYLSSILNSFYSTENHDGREFGRSYLLYARQEATAFVETQARDIIQRGTRIVACSSTFNQNCAMLALTRRVKELNPEIVTIVGGANCESEMGAVMARCFSWLDFVVSGEAELLFPELCQRVLEQKVSSGGQDLPAGVISSKAHNGNGIQSPAPPRAIMKDLNASPIPDFDDYFAALKHYSLRNYITPGLAVETARGCWWGAMHHCTFCGLNGGAMTFRSKTPDRVLSELHQLSNRYNCHRFMVADNILDQNYYKSLLPALSRVAPKYDLYFEIKANVTFPQLELLHASGGCWVVAGIESLHDEVLKLMDKGTAGWLNIQVLKWTRGLGIHVSWNMLCGLPGEEDAWYGETAQWIPLLYHLEPPNDMRIIRFDRFSPYQARPDHYGLKLRPAWPYSYIYPLEHNELKDLVYFFEAEGQSPVHINPFRQSRDASGLPTLGGPGRDSLQNRIHEWIRLFRSSTPPVMSMMEEANRTTINDTRPIATAHHVILESLAHRVHRACDRARTTSSLIDAIAEDGGSTVSPDAVVDAVEDLVEQKLILKLSDRYLALAVRGRMPTLPWNNEDGYPGGWFVYPRPAKLPEGLAKYLKEKRDRVESVMETTVHANA